jgi:hypothetical protein
MNLRSRTRWHGAAGQLSCCPRPWRRRRRDVGASTTRCGVGGRLVEGCGSGVEEIGAHVWKQPGDSSILNPPPKISKNVRKVASQAAVGGGGALRRCRWATTGGGRGTQWRSRGAAWGVWVCGIAGMWRARFVLSFFCKRERRCEGWDIAGGRTKSRSWLSHQKVSRL